jgi:hypothetical protein
MVQYPHNDNYADKLQDPRWQKKRLKILERDKWSCQNCHKTIDTLCIHHYRYILKIKPWEYPDNLLTTLCEPCHIICPSCYYFQEFGHCSCREPQYIFQYCPDYLLF